ncbi:FAD-dependent oxidoreductase [Devriesea agamarum]|uniref:FAD-dependent oxidoreductase n=1 Tax=Devriesea agamarum TaxID=472569 RepID=UPI00071D559E|nr:FAD-dependent oxidoreductase [Devriesea agamarum]
MTSSAHTSVLVIGASVSGLAFAAHLLRTSPHVRVTVIDAADAENFAADPRSVTKDLLLQPLPNPQRMATSQSLADAPRSVQSPSLLAGRAAYSAQSAPQITDAILSPTAHTPPSLMEQFQLSAEYAQQGRLRLHPKTRALGLHLPSSATPPSSTGGKNRATEPIQVIVDDGGDGSGQRIMSASWVVIATGAVARTPISDHRTTRGDRLSLRWPSDANRLRAQWAEDAASAGRGVLIHGGGWIGLETASAARHHGVPATIVTRRMPLLASHLGALGAIPTSWALDSGVKIQLSTHEDTETSPQPTVWAIGTHPATAWLADTDIALTPHVATDSLQRVLDGNGQVLAHGRVLAIGDAAQWCAGRWNRAVASGQAGADLLAAAEAERKAAEEKRKEVEGNETCEPMSMGDTVGHHHSSHGQSNRTAEPHASEPGTLPVAAALPAFTTLFGREIQVFTAGHDDNVQRIGAVVVRGRNAAQWIGADKTRDFPGDVALAARECAPSPGDPLTAIGLIAIGGGWALGPVLAADAPKDTSAVRSTLRRWTSQSPLFVDPQKLIDPAITLKRGLA